MDVSNQPAKRTFLFLQGHPSSFSRNLAKTLSDRGHQAKHITLCGGDALYWLGFSDNSHFRGQFKNWETYLRAYIIRENVTDILYYGDRKPYHVIASKIAKSLDINAFTYEFGYLRPDWITIEKNGMSAFSHFPDDPALIHQIAKQCETPDMLSRYPYAKSTELYHEVLYNLTTYFTPFLYPFYEADRYYSLLPEYLSGIPGLFTENKKSKQAKDLINTLEQTKQDFFLFPLQLQSDYQLRSNAPFGHQNEAIEHAITSFAHHAPPQSALVFKQHPLDNGWEKWPLTIQALAKNYNIEDRVYYITGGDLNTLLKLTQGCIIINSTVGMHALFASCPVKILGTALYNIKGLSHQGSLNDFWKHPTVPDPALAKALQCALAGTIQVKGNFFTKAGQDAAIPKISEMLLHHKINARGAYITPPPRL